MRAVSFLLSFRRRRGVLGLNRVNDGARFGSQILFGHAHDVVGRDFVGVIDGGEELAPIAVIGVIERQGFGHAGVAIEAADERGANFGFDALQRVVADLLRLQSLNDGVSGLLVLFDGVALIGNQEKQKEIGIF